MTNSNYQRWLAVGLLAILVMTFVFLLVVPLINMGISYHEEKTDLIFRLQRQQKIVDRKDQVAENLAAIKAQASEQGYLSSRDTEALASADLQNIVKTAVTDAGGQLTSTQGLPGKLDNGFNRVAVRVRMTGSMDTLRSVLHTFNNTVPILIVDQIDITPIRGNRRGNVNNKLETNAELNMSFQVVSFMNGETP